jgi:two-component system NtrC family sensor kinase
VASLKVIQGPDKDRLYKLPAAENVIGRQSQTVSLTDGTVSRRHAIVARRNGHWTLEDCGSANATYLNGVRVNKSATLHRGDQIRCGATLLVFAASQADTSSALLDTDDEGNLVDAAIVATLPSNEDSVIIPTPEAGAQAIGNLRILYDLITETGAALNIDQLLNRTLEKIFAVIKADRGYVLLLEDPHKPPPKGKLLIRASRQADGQKTTTTAVSRTIISEVIAKQVGILCSNAMSDKRFASGKSVHDFGIRSAMCVPIKGRENILGVIHVDSSVIDRTYSTEQLRLLTAIGHQTGLALENVRLYEAALQSERLAAVGETVAFLSHHIKNILQALDGGIDVVDKGLSNGDMTKALAAWPIVQRNIDKINQLILNMLAFSKNRQPLLEDININHLINECIQLVSGRADEQSVALMSELEDMPPIPVDSAGLQQALLNLLNNAIDAVESKSGAVTVTSRFKQAGHMVEIKVIDNGSGIEPERLDLIWTPFYSGKGHKGTGLGLAVARKVVQEHGGDLTVQSRKGEGTTFTILLPAAQAGESGDTRGPLG